MKRYRLIEVESTESTNTYAKNMPVEAGDVTPAVVITDSQTAGRGQRGNHWESQPCKNLTFSLVVYPVWMSARRQFELSMLVSLGLIGALRGYVDNPAWLKIKWPNDIYFGERKIAGILIENTVSDNCIDRSVIGIGLNVNQTEFSPDIPNPISLCHVTGFTVDRQVLLEKVVDNILDMIDSYESDPEIDQITDMYNSLLWRADNAFHKWQLPDDTLVEASLGHVDADGRLHLLFTDGSEHTYLFKEIAAVLEN